MIWVHPETIWQNQDKKGDTVIELLNQQSEVSLSSRELRKEINHPEPCSAKVVQDITDRRRITALLVLMNAVARSIRHPQFGYSNQ